MGTGSSKSRPSSSVSQHDLSKEKPIKNWEGEIIGWAPLTDSEKLQRKHLKDKPSPRRRSRNRSANDSGEYVWHMIYKDKQTKF